MIGYGDPATWQAYLEWAERDCELALDRHLARKYHHGHGGGLQCHGCRKFKPLGAHVCPHCGYLDGAGYQSVPAKTSYLERWR